MDLRVSCSLCTWDNFKGADGYETDDCFEMSTSLPVESPQIHSLHANDSDWYQICLVPGILQKNFHRIFVGQLYTMSATPLGSQIDTVIQLYDTDGNTLLAR